MKGKKWIPFITIIFFILVGCSNSNDRTSPVTSSHSGMGTITDFTVFGENAEEAIQRGKDILIDIEQKMSLSIDSSEVNEINRQAGIKPVPVSEDTFEVIKKGVFFSELTEGRFDISIAPITQLWNIGQDGQRIPTDEEIEKALSLVNYELISIDEEKRTVFLEKEGMKIDLGGIAKGYAADKVIQEFKDLGIENALVSVGGNIKVVGENIQKDRPWRVGLRHPRGARGSHFALTDLHDGETVVSSGDYERYFTENDIRYHHIFDGRTGKPSRTDIIGVSILTNNSMFADGISTSIFLMGSKDGMALINELEGVEAVIVTEDLRVLMSDGIKEQIDIESTQL